MLTLLCHYFVSASDNIAARASYTGYFTPMMKMEISSTYYALPRAIKIFIHGVNNYLTWLHIRSFRYHYGIYADAYNINLTASHIDYWIKPNNTALFTGRSSPLCITAALMIKATSHRLYRRVIDNDMSPMAISFHTLSLPDVGGYLILK